MLKEMGDGNLSKFDSALNAVLCAIEIQKHIHRNAQYKLQIGIHLGHISVKNGDIYGNVVNIASRLESISDRGGIYVSDAINKAIRGIEKIRSAEMDR